MGKNDLDPLRAGDETRTRDPQLGRLMLYQLSYFRIVVLLVGVVGFEPTQPKQQIYSLPRLSNFGAPPAFFNRYRAGGGIRTPDPLITNQLLWPTELCRLVQKMQSAPKNGLQM